MSHTGGTDAPPRVWLVDDNAFDRKQMRRVLDAGAFGAVSEFPDGRGLLSRIAESWPGAETLILLDINLPDMSGLDLLERIAAERGDRPAPRVALLLAQALSEGDLQRVAVSGLDPAMLDKPLSAAALDGLPASRG
ncbi:MAG: response regulator [Pseudooceanicola sp.]